MINDDIAVSRELLDRIVHHYWGAGTELEALHAIKELQRVVANAPPPIAWEATTPVYTRFITDERYKVFSALARRWYRPYRCSRCSAKEGS